MLLQPRYELRDDFKEAEESSGLEVLRTSDNLVFLTSDLSNIYEELPNKDRAQLAGVLLPSISHTLSQIINHYNVVSLVDIIHNSLEEPFIENAGPLKDFMVWENMNAGSLAQLLPPVGKLPGPNSKDEWIRLAKEDHHRASLPESLCWHVLRSISKALLWLHFGVKETSGDSGALKRLDDNWQCILIRDVSPTQIWFQHPVLDETYGACKLGGFGLAKVVNFVNGSQPVTLRPDNASWEKQLFWAPEVCGELSATDLETYTEESKYIKSRASSGLPYWTPTAELWSLGALVYMMMTGIPPPRHCSYELQISLMNDEEFSQDLREIIQSMLIFDPNKRPKCPELAVRIDRAWADWRASTEEGKEIIDIWDHPKANSIADLVVVMAVQSSPRAREQETGGGRDGAVGDDPVPPNNFPGATEAQKLQNLYIDTDLDSRLTAREPRQLLSPSPSASRSSSPSLVASDNSSPELDGKVSSNSNGHLHSPSFEKRTALSLTISEEDEATLTSPLPISKSLPPLALHDIPEEKPRKTGKLPVGNMSGDDKMLKLSPTEMQKLTSDPDSLPITTSRRSSGSGQRGLEPSPLFGNGRPISSHSYSEFQDYETVRRTSITGAGNTLRPRRDTTQERRLSNDGMSSNISGRRPNTMYRAISNPPPSTDQVNQAPYRSPIQGSPRRKATNTGFRPEPLDLNASSVKTPGVTGRSSSAPDPPPSPIPQSIPLPPMSMPTYLQLELSESRPSPLYIYRSSTSDRLYESSEIKFERLLNFLLLPPQLEQVLYFGTLTCLDAWLYTFTILPLRFLRAAGILIRWWGEVIVREVRFISGFIYHGAGRMWHRQRGRTLNIDGVSESRSVSRTGRSSSRQPPSQPQYGRQQPESIKGLLSPEIIRPERGRHKADLLQGAVIITSCIILLKLDASRMYHSIRGQAAIKLYVIYNLLEVCDRLFSALGQDIFECLFSNETLGRDDDGRSKILRPLGMFVLSLVYNVIHATALFYQVITLNVAVNSYSNALLTLLMSNQFVEIKSTVFKKFEKDNLFQLTCADIVERFQLWLMLLIIAMRNIVEVGGLSVVNGSRHAFTAAGDATVVSGPRSIIPNSFTILPSWSGEVLTPFLFVLGSEMLVDWIKHAYISKFNNVKPALYQRYLDVLAKDYYTHAFVDQNLIKRLGLPVIPLSCLFIRASVQTYHMFLATHFQPPIPATTTSISVDAAVTSPATTAALEHFDYIIRHALGRATYGIPNPAASNPWYLPGADDAIAALTMLVFFLVVFFLLLAFKLLLGMLLLKYSRNRYRSMKKREHQSYDTKGKRLGGWGMVEVDDDKRRWIYDDDPETLRKLKGKEKAAKEKAEKEDKAPDNLEKISRYEMAAKRIW
ncbi:hypothetical protein B7463_g6126, partial [Scytalidium lignicola]